MVGKPLLCAVGIARTPPPSQPPFRMPTCWVPCHGGFSWDLVEGSKPMDLRVGHGAQGHGSVGDSGGRGWLDQTILEGFSNRNDSVIL